MPVARQSRIWPSGGVHLWPTGGTSPAHSHPSGHLVYAASGVLSVHTERGTWIVPANRVAWIPAGSTHHHRAHGETDMRIVFLPPSLTRLAPAHPAVLLTSGLAREVLLTLTGTRQLDRGARARLHRVLVDGSARRTSSPPTCPSRTTTGCEPSLASWTTTPPTPARWPHSASRSEPAPVRSAASSTTSWE